MSIRIQPRDIKIPKNDPFKHDLLGRRDAVDTLTHLVGNLEGPCVFALDAATDAKLLHHGLGHDLVHSTRVLRSVQAVWK